MVLLRFIFCCVFLAKMPMLLASTRDESLVIVDTINEILRENNIERLSIRRYGKIIALVGTPTDSKEKELALRIARKIHPPIEDHTVTKSGGAPTVSMDVMFVEMEKQDALQIGFAGKPANNGSPNAPNGSIGGMAFETKELHRQRFHLVPADYISFLNLIRSKRSTRVLSHPRILGRSGEIADFHAGGKATYGFESVSDSGKSQFFMKEVDYGVKLHVTPILDKAGNIDTRIEAEVSDIAPSTAKNQVVDLALTNIKTAITIADGDSALLSGLTSRKQMKEVEKVPLLGDVPLLGELFKSRKSQSIEKDLLILITLRRTSRFAGHAEQFKELDEKAEADVRFKFFD